MADGTRPRDLAGHLEQLKVASGLTYEGIGRKVHLSKSAVHRYCRGSSTPREFAIVERIASTCGASRSEMAALHRLWLDATAPPDDIAEVEPAPPLARADLPASPGRTRFQRRLAAGVVGASAALLLVASAPGRPDVAEEPAQQWISGPAWTLPAAPVPSTLFGVTINSGTGAMPSFRVGAVRLWDSGTRWSEMQRRRGEFDWSAADRLVNGAEKAGVPPLFVFGSTPRWANPAAPAGPYSDGTPSPPADLDDWETFVRAVVDRYRGRIEAYELWVLANDQRFYAGSVETLVEMVRRASAIVRAGDPEATIACPGMGQLWTTEGVSFFRRFAELGGYDHCDVASVKLFQRQASDPPETMLELIASIDRVMHETGVNPKVWNTGTTYSITSQPRLDETTARNYAVRFFLVGLYARKSNLERMYFYNWGGTKIPLVLQPVGGAPTNAALAVERLQHWLRDAHSRSCAHGEPAGLPGNVFQCDFTVRESDRSYDATIRWTDKGTASVVASKDVESIHRLDGNVTAARPGDVITLTEEPVLITAKAAQR
ncbi:helix-turn-helix domain-containing protein [Lentzea terrae]|uniref:helix-turn-helix domain-containing protein n=1 Tax=Lentzea terrae TaxID=2200761 RepID=UPI000DD4D8EA|nr:helix-turn-helix domain-containing protein [Lentzea terrae]